jgi:hypothetical protein
MGTLTEASAQCKNADALKLGDVVAEAKGAVQHRET